MEQKKKIPFWTAFRAWGCTMLEKQSANTVKYPLTGKMLMFFYPIFIVCMAELNQGKYISHLVLFIAQHYPIMIFNVIIAALIYGGLCLLFRFSWIASAIQSFVYMALSITELFKYNTNGNHLIMTDMKLFRSVKSLTAFAYIKITPRLVIFVALVVIYCLLLIWFNPRINRRVRFRKRIAPAVVCLGATATIFFVPVIANPVYKLFSIDTEATENTFILNEKFTKNGFLAFFMQTATENLSDKLEEPEGYSDDEDNTISQYLEAEPESTEWTDNVQPNVIMIMSESYADFRCFEDELNELGYTDLDQYYTGFDEAASEGYEGTFITPTYASFTVRTEFELLFGLPVKSLNDPNMPQRVLLDRNQPTIVSYYKDWGYQTAYIHPYLSSFYSRKRIYGNFSFDQMIFEDDFTVDVDMYGDYIDDNVVYNQIEDLINTSEQPLYVHTTTMQNHQPYSEGDSNDEFVNYLSRISHSTEGLADFLDRLSESNEPTVVFFVGDHFPSLRGDDGIYSQLNITSDTCDKLYEQKYIIWSNYDLDTSNFEEAGTVSMYNAPYLIMQAIGAPRDSFTQAMMDKMETTPVYDTGYLVDQENDDMLDTLTYDRIFGDIVSPSALTDLYGDVEGDE